MKRERIKSILGTGTCLVLLTVVAIDALPVIPGYSPSGAVINGLVTVIVVMFGSDVLAEHLGLGGGQATSEDDSDE